MVATQIEGQLVFAAYEHDEGVGEDKITVAEQKGLKQGNGWFRKSKDQSLQSTEENSWFRGNRGALLGISFFTKSNSCQKNDCRSGCKEEDEAELQRFTKEKLDQQRQFEAQILDASNSSQVVALLLQQFRKVTVLHRVLHRVLHGMVCCIGCCIVLRKGVSPSVAGNSGYVNQLSTAGEANHIGCRSVSVGHRFTTSRWSCMPLRSKFTRAKIRQQRQHQHIR